MRDWQAYEEWAALLQATPCIDGVYRISDALQDRLNRCTSIDEVPDFFAKPTLSNKLRFVKRELTGRCVVAASRIEPGEVVCEADSALIDKPFVYSWQIAPEVHLIGPGALDHSCVEPNCGIEPVTNRFMALRAIEPGEIATFNYLTTEYEMRQPFQCVCGHPDCYGNIRGYKYLTPAERSKLQQRLPIADHLRGL